MLQKWIDRGVASCIRHSRSVIAAALLLAALCAIYTARHFAIDTDVNNLISERLPWRQSEIAFQRAFPQTVELILVDVGAGSPEAAKAAAREVLQALAKRPDLFRSVRDQLDSPFFRRNGLLFLHGGAAGCLHSSKARPVHARSSCGIKTTAQCFQAIARATAKDEVSDAPRPCTPTTSSARPFGGRR